MSSEHTCFRCDQPSVPGNSGGGYDHCSAACHLEGLLATELHHMLAALQEIITSVGPQLRVTQDDIDQGEAWCDVRLCIDLDQWAWTFYWGDVSYDQHHWPLCAAGSFDASTKALDLLTELSADLEVYE